MSTQNQTEPQNDYLSGLSKITRDIVKKSANGDYIYRGEPEHYEEYSQQISSSLYRQRRTTFESGQFDIEEVQKKILAEARNYTHEREKEDFEILTELQHYGSQTNLIDFTTDYHIALFFACDGSHDKDGRIILLEKTEEISKKYQIEKPQNPQNRVTAQKSVFVQPPKGFIDPNDVITISIPADLKQWILIHLQKFQDISTQTIYNDLHGFIKHRDLRSSREAMLPLVLAQLTMQRTPAESLTVDERQSQFQEMIAAYTTTIQYSPYDATTYVKQGNCYAEIQELNRAIETFSKAILLTPNYIFAYYNRGIAYLSNGEVDLAIEDYTKVIQLNPDDADSYYNRGIIYSHKGEYDRAIKDYDAAIELNPDYAAAYYNRGLAYNKKGDLDRTLNDLNHAIQLDPNNIEFLETRDTIQQKFH